MFVLLGDCFASYLVLGVLLRFFVRVAAGLQCSTAPEYGELPLQHATDSFPPISADALQDEQRLYFDLEEDGLENFWNVESAVRG